MNHVTIENTDVWRVDSYGNGLSYIFTDKTTGNTGHVQGEDATAWRDTYDSMGLAYANPSSTWHTQSWNACLAELCSDYVKEE